MAYIVLARRYRSRSFDELVGQPAITRTLRAAIDQDRVAHAYLFTGTRGVGKTSTARIFANALNNPENKADIAEAIMQGRDTDTIEIDAASNNSVDDARKLIEGANYTPLRGRRKIFIIDEVHMLSTAAFNALLKTMEEPPPHVVFILCTTETHKVPATIQSRCQRYDFHNISASSIAGHLKAVMKQEKRKGDDDLLAAVARLANGSMRDALSLLDRLLATGKPTLALTDLEQLLGLPERERIIALIDAIADSQPGEALKLSGKLLASASSVDSLLTAMADRFRDLLVLQTCPDPGDLVELSEGQLVSARAQAARFDAAGLVHNIALCDAVLRSCKSSSFPRALIDALVARLALAEKFADVSAIVAHAGAQASVQTIAPAPFPAAGATPAKKP